MFLDRIKLPVYVASSSALDQIRQKLVVIAEMRELAAAIAKLLYWQAERTPPFSVR